MRSAMTTAAAWPRHAAGGRHRGMMGGGSAQAKPAERRVDSGGDKKPSRLRLMTIAAPSRPTIIPATTTRSTGPATSISAARVGNASPRSPFTSWAIADVARSTPARKAGRWPTRPSGHGRHGYVAATDFIIKINRPSGGVDGDMERDRLIIDLCTRPGNGRLARCCSAFPRPMHSQRISRPRRPTSVRAWQGPAASPADTVLSDIEVVDYATSSVMVGPAGSLRRLLPLS